MDTVYIETSIVSHAVSRPSADPLVRALQVQARRWWDEQRSAFDVVTSQFVLDEAARGDPQAAADRLKLLKEIPLIPTIGRVPAIAEMLISQSLIPRNARLDALHVAVAASAGVQYLLTQNCRHIANAYTLPRIYAVLSEAGCNRPLICTPAEFLGGPDDTP